MPFWLEQALIAAGLGVVAIGGFFVLDAPDEGDGGRRRMKLRCRVLGHNWTIQTTPEGDAVWRICARCGAEDTPYGAVGGAGAQ